MEERHPAVADLTGSLCCTLLDRRSSVALSGARITCVGRDNRITRHDADRFGRFTTRLPQGVYDLVISARGYLSLLVRGVGVLAGHDQVVTRALVPGQGEAPEGEPATALGGYITDRFGHGVGNLTVRVNAERGDLAFTTRTNSDGAYLLHGIVPETYDFVVCIMERRIARQIVAVASVKDFIRLDQRIMQI